MTEIINETHMKKMSLNILTDMSKNIFLRKRKHDFDLENPIVDEITSTHHYKLSGIRTERKWTVTGFRCKKCGKILWLERYEMEHLERGMKYGCIGFDQL